MNYSIKNLQGRFVLFCRENALGILPPSNAENILALADLAEDRYGEHGRDLFLSGVRQALCGVAASSGLVAVTAGEIDALTTGPVVKERQAFLKPGMAPPPPPWPVPAAAHE